VGDGLFQLAIASSTRWQLDQAVGRTGWWWSARERESGPYQQSAQHGIDRQQNVYVADRGNRRIQVFDTTATSRGSYSSCAYDKTRHPVLATCRHRPDETQPWTICITNTPTAIPLHFGFRPGRSTNFSLPDGKILGVLGKSGHVLGQFNGFTASHAGRKYAVRRRHEQLRVQKLILHPDKQKQIISNSELGLSAGDFGEKGESSMAKRASDGGGLTPTRSAANRRRGVSRSHCDMTQGANWRALRRKGRQHVQAYTPPATDPRFPCRRPEQGIEATAPTSTLTLREEAQTLALRVFRTSAMIAGPDFLWASDGSQGPATRQGIHRCLQQATGKESAGCFSRIIMRSHGGLQFFRSGGLEPSYCREEVLENVPPRQKMWTPSPGGPRTSPSLARPCAILTFKDDLTVFVGNIEVQFKYAGTCHTWAT